MSNNIDKHTNSNSSPLKGDKRGTYKNIFASKWGIVLAGSAIGIIAILLQFWGNPPNMGFCMACFLRDIAGGLKLHSAAPVQYIRPEIIGILLGATIIAMLKGEFKPRGGSSPLIRFFLGFFAMIGALVFLGCPWRAYLRLAGGDWNAITGLAGLATGIYIGTLFIKKGFNLGRATSSQSKMSGYIMPAIMIILLAMLVFNFSKLAFSAKGPGVMHAPLIISLVGGLLVGYFAQRSRFCTIGAIRDIFIIRNYHLFTGVAAFTAIAFVLNLTLGQFNPGLDGQPIAHTNHLWNFLGMVLSGLAFVLAGGCPGRQIILAGEGNTDSGIFVLGMLLGAAIAHNFGLASSPKGIGEFGAIATIIGIGFTLVVGYVMTKRRK